MYNFIVNLFTENDYNTLLDESDDKSNKRKNKILIVPTNFEHSPFIINSGNLFEELDEKPLLSEYDKKELLKYFQLNKFINPTHNNSNNIGSNSAFMSHSLTHYKITNSFLKKDEQNKKEIQFHVNLLK